MNPQEAIQAALAKYPNARSIPVGNVAYWTGTHYENYNNLQQDKKAYGWKGDTLKAIQYVLKIQNKI